MVQTIPREPSLAELIGSGISQGLQTGMQGKMQLHQALQLEKQKQQLKQEGLQKVLGGLGFSQPIDQGQEPSQAPQEMQSQGQMLTSQNAQMSQLEKIATNPQAMVQLANYNKPAADQIQSMYGNLLKARKEKTRTFEADRAYHTQGLPKFEEGMRARRESNQKKTSALEMSRNAIESDQVGAFSKANLAKRLGIPELETLEGAALTLAGKENLLSNMSRVSAKGQNVWFEQRVNSMFPGVGKKKEANLFVNEALEGENIMDRMYDKEISQLKQKDEQEFGYPKVNTLDERARDLIKDKEQNVMKRTAYRSKVLEENDKSDIALRRQAGKSVVKGTPLTKRMMKLYKEKFGSAEKGYEAAKKNGYNIPTKEEYQNYILRPSEYLNKMLE